MKPASASSARCWFAESNVMPLTWLYFSAIFEQRGAGAFVHLGDEDELAAGFEDAENFADIAGKVGPEGASRRRWAKSKVASGQGSSRTKTLAVSTWPRAMAGELSFGGGGDASFRVFDAVYVALRRGGCEFLESAASATADVEERAGGRDGDVREAPVGERGVALVHVAKEPAAEPAVGLSALADEGGRGGDGLLGHRSRRSQVPRLIFSSSSGLACFESRTVYSLMLKPRE